MLCLFRYFVVPMRNIRGAFNQECESLNKIRLSFPHKNVLKLYFPQSIELNKISVSRPTFGG